MPSVFDPLAAYCQWVLAQPLAGLTLPPDGGVRDFGRVVSLVVHRQPPFQVELFLVREGFQEEHRHPHVDTFEVPLVGRLYLTVNGTPILADADVDTAAGLGWPRDLITPQRIGPGDWHGARVGPEGAAFLSIQVWLGGRAPTSVGLDWEGVPVSAAQEALWATEGRTGPEAGPPAEPR